MAETVRLYELPPSPNNIKIRIALNYKEIPFESIEIGFDPSRTIDEQDRSSVVEVSRQPLTPTLVHNDTVIFDSAAIMRYLEGNFPKTRPLFSTHYSTMKKIEEWETFGRTQLGEPVGIIFGQAFRPEADPAEVARASRLLHELTGRIETRLAEASWLVGDGMTAADVTAAPYIRYGMLPPEAASQGPVSKFFLDNLHIGEGREKTREWVGRVMSYRK